MKTVGKSECALSSAQQPSRMGQQKRGQVDISLELLL